MEIFVLIMKGFAIIIVLLLVIQTIRDIIEVPTQIHNIKRRTLIEVALDDPTVWKQVKEIVDQIPGFPDNSSLTPQATEKIKDIIRAYAVENAPSGYKNIL